MKHLKDLVSYCIAYNIYCNCNNAHYESLINSKLSISSFTREMQIIISILVCIYWDIAIWMVLLRYINLWWCLNQGQIYSKMILSTYYPIVFVTYIKFQVEASSKYIVSYWIMSHYLQHISMNSKLELLISNFLFLIDNRYRVLHSCWWRRLAFILS